MILILWLVPMMKMMTMMMTMNFIDLKRNLILMIQMRKGLDLRWEHVRMVLFSHDNGNLYYFITGFDLVSLKFWDKFAHARHNQDFS
mmetsp:Transcript_34226/g.79031  ORF Transcript_34226/g.79031 Transcript_34226/m.79031 type:complete len:87 (+) Transcript_34226:2255-2515(+)